MNGYKLHRLVQLVYSYQAYDKIRQPDGTLYYVLLTPSLGLKYSTMPQIYLTINLLTS